MYAFIINPNSRSGLGLHTWKKLKKILDERQVTYREYFTRYPGQGTEIARALTSEQALDLLESASGSSSEPFSDQYGYTELTKKTLTLVLLGGDGTINEVVNGIQDLSRVTMGYIPIGSGNDFARSMRLPKDPVQSLEKILNPSEHFPINIGKMIYANGSHRYAVSSGMGFDADVCVYNNTSTRIKRFLNRLKLGKLSYTAIALYLLMTSKLGALDLTLDDKRTIHYKKVYFATAMNQRYEGGGFKFCPNADPTDDMLDIIVVSGLPKLAVVLLLPTAYKGWHVHFKGIHTYTCKKAVVHSARQLAIHTDGETGISGKDVTFTLEKDALDFIC